MASFWVGSTLGVQVLEKNFLLLVKKGAKTRIMTIYGEQTVIILWTTLVGWWTKLLLSQCYQSKEAKSLQYLRFVYIRKVESFELWKRYNLRLRNVPLSGIYEFKTCLNEHGKDLNWTKNDQKMKLNWSTEFWNWTKSWYIFSNTYWRVYP